MIPSFPFDVRHLEQSYVIFEANSVEVIKGQIAFHGLAKILRGPIKSGKDRYLHYNNFLFRLYHYYSSYHRNFKGFLYDLADRSFPSDRSGVPMSVSVRSSG
jgi:hypothetical protein